MQLTFKQGLVSYQPNFLQIINGNVYLSTTNSPVVAVVSHGQANYTIVEPVKTSPKIAWTNIPSGGTSWLYWDINTITAEKTYGITTDTPIYSPTQPTASIVNQHWFNVSSNKMFVWTGANWAEKIRVFAAYVTNGSVVTLYTPGQSQSGTYSPTNAGMILFDDFGKAIKRQNGTFLTSEDHMIMDSSVTYTVRTEAYTAQCFANETIPAFSVVRVLPGNRVNLATYEDSNEGVLSLVVTDALYDESVMAVFGGVITNPDWDWEVGAKLWVGDNGLLTSTNPSTMDPGKQPQAPVAKAIAPDTIVFFPYGVTAVGNTGSSTQAEVVDASVFNKGVTKLSVAPASPANPIAVGTNDPRMTDARTPILHYHPDIVAQIATHEISPGHMTTAHQTLLNGITVSATNINTLVSVTSPVQAQINSKQDTLGYIPVDRAGDIMTGSLFLHQDPTANLQAATKQYVDTAVSFTSGFFASPVQDVISLKAIPLADISDKQLRLVEDAGAIFRYDTSSGELPNDVTVVAPDGGSTFGRWIKIQAATANHNTLIGLQGGIEGEYLHSTAAEKIIIADHLNNTDAHLTLGEKQLVSNIVLAASDINQIPATLNTINENINGKENLLGYVPVNKAGDTLSGPLLLDRDPTVALQVATKRYVDDTLASETVTVHNALTGLTADDHTQYALADGSRGDFASTNHDHDTIYAPIVHSHGTYVQLGGDTMTGPLQLNDDPTQDLHAATKQYVDQTIIADHSLLVGLANDDHPQYINEVRGDVLYYTKPLANATFAPIVHDHASITGNAGSATILQTARTINGISFDGSSDITIPLVPDPYGPTTVESVAGKSGVVTLDKNDVGLSNVDDTSDADKPVSTATQTALNLKSDATHNHDLVYEPINGNIQIHIASTMNPHGVTATQVLPSQTGNSGKMLTTDGTNVSWSTVPTVVDSIDDLSDVTITSPTSGQSLQFNGTSWINTTPSVGVTDHGLLTGLADDDHPQYLNETRGDVLYYTKTVADTTFASATHNHNTLYEPVNANIQSHIISTSNPHNVTATQVLPTQSGNTGKVLTTNGTAVSWETPAVTVSALVDLTDVNIAAPTSGQVLQFDGTDWANVTPSAGVTDHGLLTGLADDDHPQYLNDSRGDTRYYTKIVADTTFAASTHDHASITGNAATATSLQTARTINGVSFDGSANITINATDSIPRIAMSEKGSVNGVATLDGAGLVPTGQLPSYVDDVLEFTEFATFPATGEQGKIYVAADNSKTYRWSGSAYVYITSGAVDSVAGKTGVVTLVKGDVGLGNVDNTSDADKPVSTATQTALNLKSDTTHNHSSAYEPINANIQSHISSTSNPHNVTATQVLPAQTGNNGKVLKTDGTTASWDTVAVEDITGILVAAPSNGQVLQFDGTEWINATPAAGVTDHGALSGLADDDHPHYLNESRGDLRYYTKTVADTTFAATSHDHVSITGNAATATVLQTARNINGVSFNGSADITINATDATARIASSEKGAVNGVATLDATGLVPSTQLPSYVDDVLEFANLASFPATGEQGKIYVAINDNKTYRWSGSVYVYITSGAVDSVAGKTGVVTLVKGDVGLGSVDNTSDVNKPVSTATQTALNLKSDATHTHSSLYVELGGGIMTGPLTLSGDPSGVLHAATKQYVDARVRYDIASGTVGLVTASDVILRIIAVTAYSFPANMVGSRATAATGSTVSSAFSIAKNGTPFATMTYVGTTVTFAGTATTFAAGDVLTITAPASADATLADMAYTLAATLV